MKPLTLGDLTPAERRDFDERVEHLRELYYPEAIIESIALSGLAVKRYYASKGQGSRNDAGNFAKTKSMKGSQ